MARDGVVVGLCLVVGREEESESRDKLPFSKKARAAVVT